MFFLLLVVLLFLPVTAVWTSVALGTKIRKLHVFPKLGNVLIWVPILCFVWNFVVAMGMLGISRLPEPVKALIFDGNWFSSLIIFQIFIGPIATIGAAAIAVKERLFVMHSLLTIFLCVLVIWWFYTLLS
ncbi:hypothetical protein [Ruegeria sp. HKCCD7255]|uniref:hypothetical protein n=1 Tax=Ruegeria sp. HKCCD7255 TaxID=2683004 RepID=UPI001488CD28|nr:hypothetical protein [Ruegeria sp. HKCCD7255]